MLIQVADRVDNASEKCTGFPIDRFEALEAKSCDSTVELTCGAVRYSSTGGLQCTMLQISSIQL